MKENDINKWSWKDEHLPSKNYGDAYWCCARLAKVINGDLMDLFWSMGESSQSRKLDINKVDLMYLGNLDDYQEVRTTDEFKYYNKEDTLNISHANHSGNWGKCFFIKKDAVKSKDKIKQELVKRLEDLEYQAQSIQRDIVRTNQKLTELDSCEDLTKFWF